MQSFPPTIVLRHRRENLNKCSLRGLETRPDFIFYRYPNPSLPPLDGYILLALDAPPLTQEDAKHGLFILDATWRYAAKMKQSVATVPGLIERSIPQGFITAYPRRQDDCPDPERGLASIEAIYIAYSILGRSTDGLLDGYHWKEQFLQLCHARSKT
jgi:pre-rRNA-processing protein TSR3